MLIDPALALLNERAAEAADAWLTDPQDAGVYGRLLAAVAERRAHLRGLAPVPLDPVAATVDRGDVVQADDDSDAEVAGDRDAGGYDDSHDGAVRAVGDLLDPTDVRAALARLRGVR